MKTESMSKSRLKLFLTCGHAFKKKYIEKQFPTNTTDCSALIRGICVHELTEMIDIGVDMSEDLIRDTFLKVFSQFIGKQIIINNWGHILKKFDPMDIENDDPETNKWNKYKVSMDVYRELEFDYIDEMDEIKIDLHLYVKEYLNVSGKLKKISSQTIENRETMKMSITDDLEINITHVFDRTFFMNFDDVVNIERPEMTLETVKSDLIKSFKKPELQDICTANNILFSAKDVIAVLADALSKKLFPGKLEEYEKEIEIEKQNQREFLHKMGYSEFDMVPIVMEIKSTTKSKTQKDIKEMIDPYIYSMFFKENYGKLPVFMVLFLIVTPSGKTKHQIFTHYISDKQLENVRDNFKSDCKRILLHNEYKKNFADQNFLCNEKKCSYYDQCQEGLTMIVTTKK